MNYNINEYNVNIYLIIYISLTNNNINVYR